MRDEDRTKEQLLEEVGELRKVLFSLEYEKGRTEAIISALGDSIIIQDTAYHIVYQNDVNRKMFGDRKGELCHKVYEGRDEICENCPVELTFQDGGTHRSRQTVSMPEGTRHFELTSSPMRDPSGTIVAGVKIVRDITTQVEAERRLAEEIGFSEAVVKSLPGVFHLLDSRGRLRKWNRNLEQYTGYTAGELARMKVTDLFEGKEKKTAVAKIREALETGQSSSNLSLLNRGGGKTPFFFTAVRFEQDGKQFVAGVGMDISKLKEAEERLAYSERFLRSVIRHEPECVKLLDPEGRVIDMNPAGLGMLEAEDPGQVLGKPLASFVAPEDRTALAATLESVCGGRKCMGEFRVTGLKGTRRWLESHSVPFEDRENRRTLVLAVTRDITVRKKIEEELQISYSNLKAMIENTDDYTLISDSEGRPLMWNDAYARLMKRALGIEMQRGLQPHRLLEDPGAVAYWDGLHRRVLSGERFRAEYSHDFGGGEVRHYEISFNPVVKDGEVKGFTEFSRDITERKKTEEALERWNEELLSLDRMKDGLLRDVSHELKTPVAKHLMQLEILKPVLERYRFTEEEKRAFKVMEESIRRQESVIRNLLDLARLETGGRRYEMQPVALDSVLARVQGDFQYALDSYGVEFSVDAPPVTVCADGEMLWHVFSNLINNAIKFRRKDRPLKVGVSVVASESEAVVEVADNGIGIDPGDCEKIFQSFYQVSSSSEGSGIGLAICRRIIEDLGGRIWLESGGRNRGVTVRVALPSSSSC